MILTSKNIFTFLKTSLLFSIICATSSVLADPLSANYRMRWQALDGGGGVTDSTNYQLSATLLSAALGRSSSTNYALNGGFQVIPDTDNDTWRDFIDNCSEFANPLQLNANHGLLAGEDIYGNACDADLTNDGVVNFADLAAFKSVFGTPDAEANLDEIGIVNFGDLARFKALFGVPPGPSGFPVP